MKLWVVVIFDVIFSALDTSTSTVFSKLSYQMRFLFGKTFRIVFYKYYQLNSSFSFKTYHILGSALMVEDFILQSGYQLMNKSFKGVVGLHKKSLSESTPT